jgi:hypothetical protein
MTGAAKVIGGLPRIAPGDLSLIKRLIEAGELKTVIDRSYSLDEIAEAYRYAEAGHKKDTSSYFSRRLKRDVIMAGTVMPGGPRV